MVLAILVEGYLSNLPMQFECNRPKGTGEFDIKRFSIFSSGSHLVYGLWERNDFNYFGREPSRQYSREG